MIADPSADPNVASQPFPGWIHVDSQDGPEPFNHCEAFLTSYL
jgi:hypothetical protein